MPRTMWGMSDNIHRLLEIMARLRDPEAGCPWDLKQTFSSIVPHTLEEAYEVAYAIEQGDYAELRDELGDLLFQIVFYAQLAKEQQLFEFDDVVDAICDKMLRRHPHVFDEAFSGGQDDHGLHRRWHQIKQQEKAHVSLLDGITKTLPAMTLANKMQKKVAQVGFDWPGPAPVLEKVREELQEIEQELSDSADPQRLEEEVGDLLFACVNLARHLGTDPEQALRKGNEKFERRFRHLEAAIVRQGEEVSDLNLEQLEEYWQKGKRALD